MQPIKRLLFALGLALVSHAHAQLTVEISGSGSNRIPVAVPDFAGDGGYSRALTSVIRADLERSGMFKLTDIGATGLNENSLPDYAAWRNRGADAVVTGSISGISAGALLETRFRLFDDVKAQILGGSAYQHSPGQLRATGHRIADYIYEKLLGERSIFSTRIAYVLKNKGRYELQVADADGQNVVSLLVSKEPIISPTWSPDGTRLAYVSFESKKPVIYVQQVQGGARHVAANFKGSNSAPAWSPDGRRLAVVLTKDGSSQLYSVNADGSGVIRLASSPAIDTEPAWAADGSSIYFTSDRGGTPQIYQIPSTGGSAQRVTFEGSYNVTPRLSPDGKTLAHITRRDGRFQLAVLDLASRQTTILTDSSRDESPTFAPNGRMILLATEVGGRGVLTAVSTDGRVKQRLSGISGDVREPAWGPFSR